MAIAADTKQRLLEAAGPIFAAKGFGKATVREICDAAGVNLAAVSYHFGDKQSLYLATVELARQQINERSPIRPLDRELPPETRLAILIRGILHRFLGEGSDSWHLKLLNREIVNPTAACEQLIKQHFRKRFEELTALIDELGGPGLPAHELEQLAFAVTGQCFHYLMAKKFVGLMTKEMGTQEHYCLERLAEQITRFSLAGITNWKSYPYHVMGAVPPPPHVFNSQSSAAANFASDAPSGVSIWSHDLDGSSHDDV